MTEESIRRFAQYAAKDLECLLRELERRHSATMPVLIAEIRAELERRRHLGVT